jgi:hypothetical protein
MSHKIVPSADGGSDEKLDIQMNKKMTGVVVVGAIAMSTVVGGAGSATASPLVPDGAAAVTSVEGPADVRTLVSSLPGDIESADNDTQVVPVIAIITTVILAGGAAYAMGDKAALRAYHAGLRNGYWQSVKWQARVTAIGLMGPVGGSIFMTGFENKFYSLV